MSYIKEVYTRSADSPSVDAFGRARVSEVVSIFDYKSIYNIPPEVWLSSTSGAGSAVTQSPNEASIILNASANGHALLQTHRYFPYVPGKSLLILMTAVIGQPKDGLVRRIGYYDDYNGLFFELNGSSIRVARRSSTSGTVDTIYVDQDDWNLDKLDGTGSGIVLDITKSQIFVIDLQWLGVGRVRFGFSIDGNIIYCHELLHANRLQTVYMATPTLPLRCEISNNTSDSATLKTICSSINSEAGYLPPGMVFSVNHGSTLRTGITTKTPILAIKLKNQINGKPNRKTAYFVDANAIILGNNTLVETVHLNSDYTGVTADWVSAGVDSGVEYSTNITAITGGTSHIIGSSYVAAGTGQGNSPPPATIGPVRRDIINPHSFISQNIASNKSQIAVIYVTPLSNTISAGGSFSWAEFD